MSIRDRVLCRIATENDERTSFNLDVSLFYTRLILFGEVVIHSIRLKEIPFLVNLFGPDDFLSFMRSGKLRIYSDPLTTAQIGQSEVLASLGKKLLPIGGFCLASVRADDQDEHFFSSMREEMKPLDLPIKKMEKIRNACYEKSLWPSSGSGEIILEQTRRDIVGRSGLPSRVLEDIVQSKYGIGYGNIAISVQSDGEYIYAKSNLKELIEVDQFEEHRLLEKAFLSVAGINQRFQEMREFNAVSETIDGDVRWLDEKMNFLLKEVSATELVGKFHDILELASIPDLSSIGRKLSLKELMDVVDSRECVEFRSWMKTCTRESLADTAEQLKRVSGKVRTVYGTALGKSARIVAGTALGLIPAVGIVAGPAFGILDSFVLDELLKQSGPILFLNSIYPKLLAS